MIYTAKPRSGLWLLPLFFIIIVFHAKIASAADASTISREDALVLAAHAQISQLQRKIYGRAASYDKKGAKGSEIRQILRTLASRRGMFVSIFSRKGGRLVGCMGSLYARDENLLRELQRWTRAAFLHDPRQGRNAYSVERLRRGQVVLIISFIESVQPMAFPYQWNSIREGILIRYRGREALLLPGEARTTEKAMRMVLSKLGLKNIPESGMEIFSIRARRFGSAMATFNSHDPKFRGYGG